MSHPLLERVRKRYQFRCGYCGVSETEAGGELTIDHFRPLSADGDDGEDNLVYACFRCNVYKGDFFPTADDLAHGRRLLHPLRDSVALNYREDEQTGRLEPQTEAGRFHLYLLRLNRPQLIQWRLTRRLRQLLSEAFQLLHSENEDLRLRIVLLELYLRELHHRRTDEGGQGDETSA